MSSLHQGSDFSTSAEEGRASMEEGQDGTKARFPEELLRQIIGAIALDPSLADDLAAFRQYRLVSRAFRDDTEKIHIPIVNHCAKKIIEHHIYEPAPAEDVLEQFSSFAFLRKATALDLALQCEDDGAGATLNAFLSMCESLEDLDVDKEECRIEWEELQLRNQHLRRISVVGLAIPLQDPGLDVQQLSGLQEVQVKGFFTPEEDDTGEDRVWHLTGYPSGMTAIHLRSITPHVLFDTITRFRLLRNLTLSGANLGDACLARLRLSDLPELQELDLSDNLITSHGVALLSLGTSTTLRRLNLQENAIKDPSAFQLARNRSLTHLNIKGNSLSSFALGLDGNDTLKVLLLEGAGQGAPSTGSAAAVVDGHLRDFSTQLRSNRALKKLSFTYVGTQTGLDISGAGSLEVLDLGYCPFAVFSHIGLEANGGIRRVYVRFHASSFDHYYASKSEMEQMARRFTTSTREIVQGDTFGDVRRAHDELWL